MLSNVYKTSRKVIDMNWKIVLILAIVVGVVFVVSYIYGSEVPTTPAIRVKVDIEGNMSYAVIRGFDASLVNVSKAVVQKSDEALKFPSVAINVLENMRPISYYRYLDYKGSGLYEIDVGLVEPLQGDKVRIIVQVFDKPNSQLIGIKADVLLNKP